MHWFFLSQSQGLGHCSKTGRQDPNEDQHERQSAHNTHRDVVIGDIGVPVVRGDSGRQPMLSIVRAHEPPFAEMINGRLNQRCPVIASVLPPVMSMRPSK